MAGVAASQPGTRVLVTGASRGIGREIARDLVEPDAASGWPQRAVAFATSPANSAAFRPHSSMSPIRPPLVPSSRNSLDLGRARCRDPCRRDAGPHRAILGTREPRVLRNASR